jgi:hypothetical protein
MEKNYAFIKNNNIVNTAIFDDPSEELLNLFKAEHNVDDIILGNNKAVVNGTYDGTKFWLPQPYPSWIKDEELNEWVAPVAEPEFDPENPMLYRWNEEILNWEEISE